MNKGIVYARLVPIEYDLTTNKTEIGLLLPDSFNYQYRELAFPASIDTYTLVNYLSSQTLADAYYQMQVITTSTWNYPHLYFEIQEINDVKSVPAADLFKFSGKVDAIDEEGSYLFLDGNLFYGDIDDIEVGSDIEIFSERINRHLVINNWKEI